MIITDSLSTMMAISDRKQTKNPKKQTIRKLMDQQGGKITLLWVPEHVGITRQRANTKHRKYPLQEFTKWIERKHQEEQPAYVEQHDKRDEGLTQNRLLQSNTGSDHEP
jgi:hypothetical protein